METAHDAARSTRRTFVTALAGAGASRLLPGAASGFYRVERRNGHWWFIAPDGSPEFGMAMNHIDSATLRYTTNVKIWRDKYGNSEERWLREGVAANLKRWNFNSVGWVQEFVMRSPSIRRHSRNFSYEQYQWLGMPYCHMLPFAEFHQWETETRNPDIYSKDFEYWCDAVARDSCPRMADDPKLIGYFYVDCPTWVHKPAQSTKPPLFDPQKLDTAEGRKMLFDLATRYYQVTHDAIRRYDRNHLILGDRYEALQRLPFELLMAAKPYVDVLSFQDFAQPEAIVRDFQGFAQVTNMPLLVADSPIPDRLTRPRRELGPRYAAMIRALREMPSCIGWHVCGAYLKNRTRNYGFLDEDDTTEAEFSTAVTEANRETAEWVRKQSAERG